eukprot:CAMPEP_0182422386 /NCGR_PEP_ID=MMETSP1167-20130531/8058_1 /TAXON_ID=2988 /ORGANISM="Mallomonas Sp, Strain CCMP3275" /LENGTH=467 /DNA_ID=CAMNT_0024600403 /DNA_START=46 /DNA_END=1449 /DNA_ORIENTATION=+
MTLSDMKEVVVKSIGSVLFAVIVSPTDIISSVRLLQMIRDEGVDVRRVLSVGANSPIRSLHSMASVLVSESASYIDDSGHKTQLLPEYVMKQAVAQGLGREVWRAASLEVFRAGLSDMCVLVSDTGSYTALQSVIEGINPFATCIRVDPSNFHLDDDAMEEIMSSLSVSVSASVSLAARSTTHAGVAALLTRNFTDFTSSIINVRKAVQSSVPSGKLLRAVAVRLTSLTEGWDARLLQTCLRRLFPQAVMGTSIVSEGWEVPPNTNGLVGIRRAIFLAKVKVLTQRQRSEGLKRLELNLNSIPSEKWKMLCNDMLSVHGTFSIRNTSQKNSTAILEACTKHVMIKPQFSPSRSQDNNLLTIYGIFDNEECDIIRSIFSWCLCFSLSLQKLPSRNDISTVKRAELQIPNLTDPLPSGWYFDGQLFIDCDGNRCNLRPDIDDIVNKYLQKKNEDISMYNSILEEVKEFV